MNEIILVSHSPELAEGLADMINQMVQDKNKVKIVPIGGTSEGKLGTDPVRIISTLKKAKLATNILIFCDIGSSVLSAESALDLLDDIEIKKKVKLVDAPLVEGAFAAGVSASVNDKIDDIMADVAESKQQKKFA